MRCMCFTINMALKKQLKSLISVKQMTLLRNIHVVRISIKIDYVSYFSYHID